jgi:mitotic spindle assembly checkpoint protein MAD2
VQKYGLTLLVTTDPELIKYLNNVVEQLKGNIMSVPHIIWDEPRRFCHHCDVNFFEGGN